MCKLNSPLQRRLFILSSNSHWLKNPTLLVVLISCCPAVLYATRHCSDISAGRPNHSVQPRTRNPTHSRKCWILNILQLTVSFHYNRNLERGQQERGEGLLKTTQDLFHQAEVFAAAGIKLSSILHTFSNQLEDDDKPLLLLEIEKLVPLSQQVQITSRTPVQGKTATFTKVDTCILKSKAIMMILSQILPICCKLLRKCKAGSGCYRPTPAWRENRLQNVANEDGLEGKSVEAFGVKSLEHHVANLTFLESK